jgi:hypothetical protein
MCNPYSDDPRLDLAPHPERSAGYRLWAMLRDAGGPGRAEYLHRFERVNVLRARVWNKAAARRAGWTLAERLCAESRRFLVLGDETREAMDLPKTHPLVWLPRPPLPPLTGQATYAWAPHPSGRCRWYNDEANRATLGRALLDMLEGKIECCQSLT